MFINVRYLVISLIAVFIALGIGILIGFQLDSNGIILQQQQELIASLEATFDDLTETNNALRKEIGSLEQSLGQNQTFMKAIANDYVRYRLQGQNILFIQTSANPNYTEAKHALQAAGAQIATCFAVPDKMTHAQDPSSNADLSLPAQIAAAISHGDMGTLEYLIQQGLVSTEDPVALLETIPPDFVVIAGGGCSPADDPELFDLPLIRELKQRSLPVIGVETSDAQYSYIDYYKKELTSTVDNVDTIIGQTSLILVMDGMEGNYGVKASATTLLPLK